MREIKTEIKIDLLEISSKYTSEPASPLTQIPRDC